MPSESANRRLDSWKEIAAYLRRDERTVQRWRRERGLPVHQVPHGKRGSVYAFTDELDGWLSTASAEHLPNGPANGPARSPATVEVPAAGQEQSRKRRAAAAVAVVVVLAAAALTALHLLSVTPEVPARFSFSGSSLVAYAADGRPLWTHTEPGTLVSLSEAEQPERDQVVVRDIDGDGVAEILVALSRTDPARGGLFHSELLRFSPSGELLERYSPQDTVEFAGRDYGPPWNLRAMLLTEEADGNYVWLAFSHNTWWPSLLVKRDAQGREVGRFVSAGWILALAEVRNDAGSWVLAGGISNEWASAFLAVLRATNPSGGRPQSRVPPISAPVARRQSRCAISCCRRPSLRRLPASPITTCIALSLLRKEWCTCTRRRTPGRAEACWRQRSMNSTCSSGCAVSSVRIITGDCTSASTAKASSTIPLSAARKGKILPRCGNGGPGNG